MNKDGCNEKILDLTGFEQDPVNWLTKAGIAYGWIIAYADDGLIWGRMENGAMKLSNDIFPKISPKFRCKTLQQIRLFNKKCELHIWRKEGKFEGCLINDTGKEMAFCEDYIMSGTKSEEIKDGFTLLSDGVQGLRHAVPLEVNIEDCDDDHLTRPMRLKVKNYISYDEDGQAYISAGRMVDVINASERGV